MYLVLLANQEQTGKAVFFIFDGDFFGCGEKREGGGTEGSVQIWLCAK